MLSCQSRHGLVVKQSPDGGGKVIDLFSLFLYYFKNEYGL